MIIKNPWVGYLDRSYQQIKARILTRLGQTIPEISDHSDSNILVVIIEAFAGVAEQLNYYIDNMAREAFITTARRYSSAVKLTRLIDYRIKSMVPSSVDITIEFLNQGLPYSLPSPIIIPSGTIFTTANNISFTTTTDTTVPTGSTFVNLPLKQKTLVSNYNIGTTTNLLDQTFSLGVNYVHNSLELKIGTDDWFLKETLGFSGPLDKHYIVEISAEREAYIKFGDNINGAVPAAGLVITGNLYTSKGVNGNVNPNTITSSTSNFTTLFGIPGIKVYNSYKAVGGTDYEDIERIRRSAPLSLRTLGRAVTRQDYRDIALLAPGVDKAKEYFNCGKFVYLYVSPNGGGIASNGFLADIVTYFEDKKMITTFVKPMPCGESHINMDLTVTAKFRVDGLKLRADIIKLLIDKYSYNNSDINKTIRLSDLISVVDNYSGVDYLKLNKVYLKPYIRPLTDTTIPLNYTISLNEGAIDTVTWRVKYDGVNMLLLKNNNPITNLTIGTPYTDANDIITLTILTGTYSTGDEWVFKTIPINRDLLIDDYSIPVVIENDITLIVNEQLSI